VALYQRIAGVIAEIPPAKFFRYLLVGTWNTAFGYSLFALFTYLFSQRWPQNGYIPASVLSSFVGITVSYCGFKFFVFKTKGNYLREWLRCLAVYGSGIAISWILLPCAVYLIRHMTTMDKQAPYLGAAAVIGLTTVYNFLGHLKFSFREAAVNNPLEAPIDVYEP
jgi:putative flippase GtrA